VYKIHKTCIIIGTWCTQSDSTCMICRPDPTPHETPQSDITPSEDVPHCYYPGCGEKAVGSCFGKFCAAYPTFLESKPSNYYSNESYGITVRDTILPSPQCPNKMCRDHLHTKKWRPYRNPVYNICEECRRGLMEERQRTLQLGRAECMRLSAEAKERGDAEWKRRNRERQQKRDDECSIL